ncbi:sulfite exporter TauE/SafE family protein [Thalassomonas sp. M1454]|uniref:sulfite exporter TauE/SafE family protein n=1 Tax=Thalassomonas sp. M1454 TaxID=2594477 RepID=UPI0011815304|nr:sulfite exporter TauE/SafE family protein [Thalassomonas sp. M1454]TRX55238.1 sulfite exporter TauE/SafE family protein [Thalassomonas sp. M1454]
MHQLTSKIFPVKKLKANYKAIVVSIILLVLWLVFFFAQAEPLKSISEFGGFLFLGIAGAIAANSTGAGGGVVFVPSFQALSMDVEHIIATSFAIQCFGMTMGSISWLNFFRGHDQQKIEKVSLFYRTLGVSIPFSILGLFLVQYANWQAMSSINNMFSLFSLVFGVIVLLHCVYVRSRSSHRGVIELTKLEILLIAATSFIGGIITAWISVGVGEILAVILLLRGFSVMFSVAAGVMVSACTVLAGVPFFIYNQLISYDVLMYAAPGALIGGFIARYIAQALGAKKLKLFLGLWILLVGLIGIF